MTSSGPMGSCPKCGSTDLKVVQVKRSTLPAALVADYSPPAGEVASDSIPQNVCGRCGCRWVPRSKQERELRALSGQLGPEAMKAAQAQVARITKMGASAWTNIPLRTWVLAFVTIAMILLAIFTRR